MKRILLFFISIGLLLFSFGCSLSNSSNEDFTRSRIAEANAALQRLYSHTAGARQLAAAAEGVLVFPDMTKAGFLVGGQYGNGVLFRGGRAVGFYNSTAASYGLQAGVQKFGYAMFFMKPSDLEYLTKSDGWEVGVGPSVTVVDQGFAKAMTTTTAREGIYVFFFEQRGLMAGLGIQGTKITRTS